MESLTVTSIRHKRLVNAEQFRKFSTGRTGTDNPEVSPPHTGSAALVRAG